MERLKQGGDICRLLFVTADLETIIKRYKETRRRHPLMTDGMTIEQAMHREQELLRPLREHADFVIDTTLMPAAKLRNELYGLFGDKSARGKLSVNVVSFGFKYGIPLEADLVFDVRFLPNPFYVPELKHKTGMDSEVYDYVFSFPQTKTFIDKLEGMLSIPASALRRGREEHARHRRRLHGRAPPQRVRRALHRVLPHGPGLSRV